MIWVESPIGTTATIWIGSGMTGPRTITPGLRSMRSMLAFPISTLSTRRRYPGVLYAVGRSISAVGTPVTGRPPHFPGRAVFPHLMCCST